MKQNIADIDANFKIDPNVAREGLVFRNIQDAPFEVNGLVFENGRYRRFPEAVAKTVSDGVYALHDCTAGGRVRFKTDSPYIAIYAKYASVIEMPHFALTGSAGFDMYITDDDGKQQFAGTYLPFIKEDEKDGGKNIQHVIDFWVSKEREITINFPLYSKISSLCIGLKDTASLSAPSPYTIKKPVVYYGSSITQGGCASRPGNSYQSILSRRFDCDFINLGFSGNARGEKSITEYIKGLDMSAFVLDYDHNAPSVEHLRDTHHAMFRAVRDAHPTLPIILMPRPKHRLDKHELERRQVIEETYAQAKAAGDEHVYYIDNLCLTQLCGDEGTVDGTHPNDFGFAAMARALENVFEMVFISYRNSEAAT